MLTVDYDLLDVRPGMTLLDLGCGEGRHAFEAFRRGATVLAVDWGQQEVATTTEWLGAIAAAGEAPAGAAAAAARGDLRALPVPDGTVDRVIASEVLEHIPDDRAAFAEIARVLGTYTWRRTAERTAEWYADVLDRRAATARPTTPGSAAC